MLHYKLYQNKSKGNKAYGKWFARAMVTQTIDLEQLAEHMANHNTPYSKGAILGVLTDMVNCIRELVLDGNAVKIPNLAIFSAGLTTKARPQGFSNSPPTIPRGMRWRRRAVKPEQTGNRQIRKKSLTPYPSPRERGVKCFKKPFINLINMAAQTPTEHSTPLSFGEGEGGEAAPKS